MKKFVTLWSIVCCCLFAVGCARPADQPAADPPPAADDAGATDDAATE